MREIKTQSGILLIEENYLFNQIRLKLFDPSDMTYALQEF